MTKIRTEVFIETNETYIIKRNRIFVRSWCAECEHQVSMIPLSDAAYFIHQDTETVYSMIAAKQIHCCYLKAEIPLICLRSLSLI
jgi:hypothetical protein